MAIRITTTATMKPRQWHEAFERKATSLELTSSGIERTGLSPEFYRSRGHSPEESAQDIADYLARTLSRIASAPVEETDIETINGHTIRLSRSIRVF